jgi:hypothetical protein
VAGMQGRMDYAHACSSKGTAWPADVENSSTWSAIRQTKTGSECTFRHKNRKSPRDTPVSGPLHLARTRTSAFAYARKVHSNPCFVPFRWCARAADACSQTEGFKRIIPPFTFLPCRFRAVFCKLRLC